MKTDLRKKLLIKIIEIVASQKIQEKRALARFQSTISQKLSM